MKRVTLLLSLTALLASGCAGTATISDGLWARLSREDRSAIYERQNEVTIAYSRLDEAQLFLDKTAQRLDELDDRWSKCKARLEKANQAARVDGAKKLKDTQEAFFEDQLRIAEARVRFRQREIEAAKAKLEMAKQRQLVKSGFATEKSLDDFDHAVREADQDARAAERKELDVRAESQKKFLDWKAAEAEYSRASGDFDSLVWID